MGVEDGQRAGGRINGLQVPAGSQACGRGLLGTVSRKDRSRVRERSAWNWITRAWSGNARTGNSTGRGGEDRKGDKVSGGGRFKGPRGRVNEGSLMCLLKEPPVKTGATLGESHSEQEPNRGEMRAVLSIYDTAMGGDGGFV